MELERIYKTIDHTLLKPTATWDQIKVICEESLKYHTASVCIPAGYVAKCKKEYGDKGLNICTVIGFPLGYSTSETKAFEAKDAIEKGANEIDMVINICDLKNKDYDAVASDIRAVREATKGHVLKVIIETCYLTEEEKIKMCEIVTDEKADYIKTSTGFGTGGATIEDIRLFAKHIGPDVKMKAAGGVKSREDLEMFIEAGCDRIGTSSAIRILNS